MLDNSIFQIVGRWEEISRSNVVDELAARGVDWKTGLLSRAMFLSPTLVVCSINGHNSVHITLFTKDGSYRQEAVKLLIQSSLPYMPSFSRFHFVELV